MTFLDTRGLAERWKCSTRTIEQHRLSGDGPAYVKIGNRVLYDLDVVREFETMNTLGSTSEEANPSSSRRSGRSNASHQKEKS